MCLFSFELVTFVPGRAILDVIKSVEKALLDIADLALIFDCPVESPKTILDMFLEKRSKMLFNHGPELVSLPWIPCGEV